MKRRRIKGIAITGILIAGIALVVIFRSLSSTAGSYPILSEDELFTSIQAPAAGGTLSYTQIVRGKEYAAFKQAEQVEAKVLATDFSAASPDASVQRRQDETKRADVIDWNNAKGWMEWKINVPQDGLYDLMIDYAPIAGTFSPIERGIRIDGNYPFREAEHIRLDRYWQDGKFPYDQNSIGNEIRPLQQELKAWNAARVTDYSLSSEPLRWALTKGVHTIRLVGMKEPVSLHSLALASPVKLPSYKEYVSGYPAGGKSKEWFQLVEAEKFKQKTAVNIRTLSVSEAYVSPDPKGRLVYNTVGGEYWQQPGETIEWEITVPETGFYAIDHKYFQGFNTGANVYRTVQIDGKVPFREMLHYRFSANDSLAIKTFADSEGKPYLFYLEKGTHRLAMIADNSLLRPAVQALNQMNDRLTAIERDIRVLTGNYGFAADQNLDEGRVWDLAKYDPDIEAKLQSLIGDMKRVRDYVTGLNQAVTDPATALSASIDKLEQLADDVNDIPNKIKMFSDIKTSLNTWIKPIENQPLQLDYLVIRTPETDPGLKVPNTWNKVQYTTVNFMRTFFQKYDMKEANDEKSLTIWVKRGKDYVDLLQQTIEQDFTPKTGIKVNVNLIQNQNVLLMGNAAGDQPDLALGVSMEAPVDYAMRGAAEDLSSYPGFEEVVKRFNPGVMRSYQYENKVYGFPETQLYNMLFYRTDIFEQLGIKPPDTWEDVLTILPTLQENGMSFMYPKLPTQEEGTTFMPAKPDFLMSYYQQGAEFFTSDGLQPQLTDSKGLAAFKQWTEWFSKYNVPKEVPAFFNHFRFGDMPIGVSDINMYPQLVAAAPELAGHWKMIPIPGTRQQDGTVARWSMLGTESAMIMKKSDKKEEAWKFLEWWTSEKVQTQYGIDIESFAGILYRWYTSNTNAMQHLLWEDEELSAINEQDSWAKNMPFVPGYYLLPREMDFAWNEAVLEGKPPREALERTQMTLMREMKRKQEELGITPDNQLHVTPYDKPYRRE
ncbi:extracellular solute-binding protein [Paenibacillus sp. MBLB4367]|uniref:extracellular solute-binding protein n=1 Tax=Paenibacillus sp. MBLB4367 TaxID=3384767 RepID=UPI0039082088